MRVAQVVGSFGGGGAERQAYNLVEALGGAGVDSCGIAVRTRGDFATDGRCDIDEIRAPNGGPAGSVRALARFRALVRRRRIDVLHVHGARSLPFAAIATWGMVRAPKFVFTWHDSEHVLEGGTKLDRASMIWALRRCRAVFGSSTSVAERLAARAGLSSVGVFHGGVPKRDVCRPDVQAPPTVLWMGRLVPGKDPEVVVRCAARLKDMGLRFKIVLMGAAHHGSRYGEEMRRLVSDLGVDDVVEMPGYVEHDGLATYLNEASAAVQSSHSEGLSMAVLEQMMAGLAIVATDVGDTRCAVRHGETGLLVPPRDEDALTHALARVISEPDLRRTLGAAARKRAVEEFSFDAMRRRAVEAYRSIGEP